MYLDASSTEYNSEKLKLSMSTNFSVYRVDVKKKSDSENFSVKEQMLSIVNEKRIALQCHTLNHINHQWLKDVTICYLYLWRESLEWYLFKKLEWCDAIPQKIIRYQEHYVA